MIDLTGRTAIVTGAGRGIGRQIALKLALAGARVAGLSRTLSDLAELEQSSSGGVTGIVCDVTNRGQVEKAFADVSDQMGPVSILVCAAGLAWSGPTLDMPPDDWDAQVSVNLTGLFHTNMAAIRQMMTLGTGDIVNILSVMSTMSAPGWAAYCATKHGALGLTRSLNAEYRSSGIRVLSIMPGATDTTLWKPSGVQLDTSLMIRPEQVADAVVWMISQPRSMAVDEMVVMPRDGFL